MTSSTSLLSVFASQTTSIAQGDVSTSASTLASVTVIPEELIEIFALDQIHDFYNNGYSQDEADVVTLFLGVSAIVYLIGYIASLFILRHRRKKRKVWRDAMTEYYRSGGIPPWQTDGVPRYINGTPHTPDPDDDPYYSQPSAPYMAQLHRIQLPLPSDNESLVVGRSQVPATPNLVAPEEIPLAIISSAQRRVEIAQPPVPPSAETLI